MSGPAQTKPTKPADIMTTNDFGAFLEVNLPAASCGEVHLTREVPGANKKPSFLSEREKWGFALRRCEKPWKGRNMWRSMCGPGTITTGDLTHPVMLSGVQGQLIRSIRCNSCYSESIFYLIPSSSRFTLSTPGTRTVSG